MIKKAIVTGGAGFIGSNLVNKLLETGTEEIIVLDNLSTGRLENINLNPKVKFIQIDISDSEELKKIYDQFTNTDVIFHLAAKARVQPSIQDPILFNKHNVDGTLNMLVVAKDNNIKRFVYSASSSAYGNASKMPLDETMPTNPMSPYGLQKLIGEEYCKLFSFLYNIETVSLRYFNVFGENQPTEGAYCTVIGIFSRLKKEGSPLTIINDGEQRRDMTYVGDVVLANILSATSDKVGKGEVINIGSGKNYSVNQLADMFNMPKVFAGNVIEPKETLADNSKAKELLDWSPTINVIDWLEKNIK
ncbi:MAG: NAD-dependent epimerase/dehydratase family protein [Nanoarchaeota archaeon]